MPMVSSRLLEFAQESGQYLPMMDTAVLDLDEKSDLAFMEVIASYLYETDEAFNEIRVEAAKIDRTAH